MDRAASTALRRCLRSKSAVKKCITASPIFRTPCIASSICPARRPMTVASLPLSNPNHALRRSQESEQRNLRSSVRYSTSEATTNGTIGKGEAGVADEAQKTAERLIAPEHLDEKERQIWDMLMTELECTELEVQDISGGCGSMYGIEAVSEKFRGLNMLKQQRLVNQVLGEEIKGWHGVQLKTRAP